jgi:hypothetical protein
MDPPPCVQNAMMKQDKKPFTYTPGGIDLSEIKSPRMARRIERNANYTGAPESPRPQAPQPVGPLPPSALAAMQPQMHVQVFPSGPPPPPPGPRNGPPPPPPPPFANIPRPPPPPTEPLATQKNYHRRQSSTGKTGHDENHPRQSDGFAEKNRRTPTQKHLVGRDFQQPVDEVASGAAATKIAASSAAATKISAYPAARIAACPAAAEISSDSAESEMVASSSRAAAVAESSAVAAPDSASGSEVGASPAGATPVVASGAGTATVPAQDNREEPPAVPSGAART